MTGRWPGLTYIASFVAKGMTKPLGTTLIALLSKALMQRKKRKGEPPRIDMVQAILPREYSIDHIFLRFFLQAVRNNIYFETFLHKRNFESSKLFSIYFHDLIARQISV